MTEAKAAQWWGEYDQLVGTTRRWRVGPMTLWVQRFVDEWRIARETGEDPPEPIAEMIEVADDPPDLLEYEVVDRYGMTDESGDRLSVMPALANRPVVVKPQKPLIVPSGQQVVTFVDTILWVQLSVARARRSNAELLDQPICRPSDTWFGPPTDGGELCYGSLTHMRLHLESVVRCPHRALTAAHLSNQADEPLVVEALKLPVQYLDLYRAADGTLWTEDVTFERKDKDDFAELRQQRPRPSWAPEPKLVVKARRDSQSPVVRAFSAFFTR